ncbi:hypothetical protein [Cellulophaga sp. RHA_52]|uniref:hypothetical protein n=1 Tax=Cellulophaga sp. RHA_52 TaxID=1250036 RepID=UPI0011A111BC|nr:hypothetical protein [Cellulophaga sp. RHA_52]
MYRSKEWHHKDEEAPVTIFPKAFLTIKQLEKLVVKNASALVLNTDCLPKYITNLTISEIKGIEAGSQPLNVFSMEVKATQILNLQQFHTIISAAKFNLGHRNNDVEKCFKF